MIYAVLYMANENSEPEDFIFSVIVLFNHLYHSVSHYNYSQLYIYILATFNISIYINDELNKKKTKLTKRKRADFLQIFTQITK